MPGPDLVPGCPPCPRLESAKVAPPRAVEVRVIAASRNAYRVLGEMDRAREAFLSAEKLASNLASDDPRRVAIRDVLSEYSD